MPRFDTEEVADEVVALAAFAVGGAGGSVASAGDDEKIEILIRFDEGVDDLHC